MEPDDETQAPGARTPYDWIGGETVVQALCDRFYDLMDLEPNYAALRSVHGSDLTQAREKLFWFLCGWLGGPDLYVQRFGHPRLRARHLPYPIGLAERDQWMACMTQALRECGVEPSLQDRLRQAFAGTADWMRNRGG